MKVFTLLDREYCRCTAEEVGMEWQPRWGRDDAANHLCDPILIGKAKPDESQFEPIEQPDELMDDLELARTLYRSNPADFIARHPSVANKLLELGQREKEILPKAEVSIEQMSTGELRNRLIASIREMPPPDFIEHLQQGYKHLVDVYIPAHRQKAAANDCEAMMRYVRKVIDSAP